ncbi:Ldh family oxidoreductase, partial [Salmonella enterica subsp. enterica serovar Anatum]|nr:Ldh family oxidoreductase [Salmonella enterica subsp. enterica serovar Anatum]
IGICWTNSIAVMPPWGAKECRIGTNPLIVAIPSTPITMVDMSYEFTSNKPVIADGQLFVGLALDETNQYDLSDERIQTWCEQIL